MSDPRLTALAAALPRAVPFVGPEALERARGAAFGARLGANESPFGPSSLALTAMERAVSEVWMYPDPESHDLRAALAAHHGLAPENVVVGPGIDGLLGTTARLCLAPGEGAVMPAGGYPTFAYHVRGVGGVLHPVPYREDRADLDGMARAARESGARLVYLSNPDNPTGSWHPPEAVARLRDALPEGALLILDEAYAECSDAETAPPDPRERRVIRFRTFSKAYGLAGARVGYAMGPADLIGAYDLMRDHFGLSRISQAGALAALSDQGYLGQVRRRIAESADRIAAIARDHGLVPGIGAANFVTVDCGGDGARATAVLRELAARGVFVRQPGVAPLDRCLRISCGGDAEMSLLARALPQALDAA